MSRARVNSAPSTQPKECGYASGEGRGGEHGDRARAEDEDGGRVKTTWRQRSCRGSSKSSK